MFRIAMYVGCISGFLLATGDAWAGGIMVNKAGEGKVLDAHSNDVKRNGCRVQLWDFKNAPQQQWKFEEIGEGYYKLVNQASGLVLDAHSDDVNVNGCRVQLWEYTGGEQQQWSLKKVGDYFKIINRASGKVLDAHSDDVTKNGCRIQLWEDNDGDQCLWKLN